ncbi:MAG: hypothetical protein Q9220_001005 [cf. Caloplaca sp. 1 TL-2023]
MSKLLTVFGATGQQGGSILQYLLKRPDVLKGWQLRGITRDVEKPASVALKDAGVEMVKVRKSFGGLLTETLTAIQADMDDEDSLKAAVAGSYAVFAMTNYWEKASPDVEIAQGKAMADASVAAGVELIVWASLPDVTAMTDGKLPGVKHFDSKAVVERYFRTLPIKSAFFMPALYMQMMTHIFRPRPDNKGGFVFTIAWGEDSPCPLIDITDTAKFIVPFLLDPDKYNGKVFIGATAFHTPAEMVQTWKSVTGKEMRYAQTKDGEFGLDIPPEVSKVMKNSAGLIDEYVYYGPTEALHEIGLTLSEVTEVLRRRAASRSLILANDYDDDDNCSPASTSPLSPLSYFRKVQNQGTPCPVKRGGGAETMDRGHHSESVAVAGGVVSEMRDMMGMMQGVWDQGSQQQQHGPAGDGDRGGFPTSSSHRRWRSLPVTPTAVARSSDLDSSSGTTGGSGDGLFRTPATNSDTHARVYETPSSSPPPPSPAGLGIYGGLFERVCQEIEGLECRILVLEGQLRELEEGVGGWREDVRIMGMERDVGGGD